MRSKIEQIVLHVTIPRNNNLSEFIGFISKGRGRGGSELESIADNFKNISIRTLVDTNWAPTEKIFIGFLLKWSAQFVPGFYVVNRQIPMNRRNSTKSRLGTLTLILVSTRITSSTKKLAKIGKILWGKSIHWCIICLPHQVFLHIVNSQLPSYGICHSISIPLYTLVGRYHLSHLVCSWEMEVYHRRLRSHLPKGRFYPLGSLHE